MKMDKSLTELLQMIGKMDEAPLSVVSDAVEAREDELVWEKLQDFPIGSRVAKMDGSGDVKVVVSRNPKTLKVTTEGGDLEKVSAVKPDEVEIISEDNSPKEENK